MPERTPDASRPQLTQERIARVVQVSEQLRPHHLDVADYLDQGDIGTGYDFIDNRMIPTVNLVGPDGMAALVAMREDPAAYARDVFWMRVISSAVRGSGSVDQKMRQIHETERIMVGTALFSPGIRALRRELHTLLLLHARIGRDEEAAVRARMADIHRVTFIPQQRRAAAFRDSVLRDSVRRAARGR